MASFNRVLSRGIKQYNYREENSLLTPHYAGTMPQENTLSSIGLSTLCPLCVTPTETGYDNSTSMPIVIPDSYLVPNSGPQFLKPIHHNLQRDHWFTTPVAESRTRLIDKKKTVEFEKKLKKLIIEIMNPKINFKKAI